MNDTELYRWADKMADTLDAAARCAGGRYNGVAADYRIWKMKDGQQTLRGMREAHVALDGFIDEARKACKPYGKRQGRTLVWWQGRFDGLVGAKAVLARPHERKP